MSKAKPLYGHVVCKKCYYDFAHRRQLAFLLDVLGLCLLAFVVGVPLGIVMALAGASQSDLQSAGTAFNWVLVAIFCCKDCFSGHSLGKFLCGVRAIDGTTGKPVGIVGSFMRNLPLAIPLVLIIVAFQMYKGHRVGDGWSDTKVIWKKYTSHPIFAPVLTKK